MSGKHLHKSASPSTDTAQNSRPKSRTHHKSAGKNSSRHSPMRLACACIRKITRARPRPNRNSIDLVQFARAAIHLAPSGRCTTSHRDVRDDFREYSDASVIPFAAAQQRQRAAAKKRGQLSGRPPNCPLITAGARAQSFLFFCSANKNASVRGAQDKLNLRPSRRLSVCVVFLSISHLTVH